jgi:hypothetical protein
MAEIENYPVAFGDRAVVKCRGADSLKELFAPGARLLETAKELINREDGATAAGFMRFS